MPAQRLSQPIPTSLGQARVYVCLGVTCHLHFWQNDRSLLRVTAVTRGWDKHQDSLLVRARDSWLKGCEFEFRQDLKFLCSQHCVWLLFSVCSTPLLPQWHIKGLGHSTKSAGGRLHLNMHTPFTHRSRSGLTMPLSRQSVEIYQKTSSHATCQGTLGHSHLSSLKPPRTDPGLKSGISLRKLISTLKGKK